MGNVIIPNNKSNTQIEHKYFINVILTCERKTIKRDKNVYRYAGQIENIIPIYGQCQSNKIIIMVIREDLYP